MNEEHRTQSIYSFFRSGCGDRKQQQWMVSHWKKSLCNYRDYDLHLRGQKMSKWEKHLAFATTIKVVKLKINKFIAPSFYDDVWWSRADFYWLMHFILLRFCFWMFCCCAFFTSGRKINKTPAIKCDQRSRLENEHLICIFHYLARPQNGTLIQYLEFNFIEHAIFTLIRVPRVLLLN